MTQSRQEQYYTLIDELLRCPNGEEPDLLHTNRELLDKRIRTIS